MHRRLAGISCASAIAIAGAALPAAAGADTVRFGSALQHANTPATCDNCVGVQLGQAGGSSPLPLRSPANGVLTSWSVRTGDVGAVYTLRVLRPTGGNTYTAVNSNVAPAVPPGTTDSVIAHPTSLPIRQGDAAGVSINFSATGLPVYLGGTAADVTGYSIGVPADGASVDFTPLGSHELLIQATVQFCNVPILKKLKTKPAKQALRAHDCLPKVKRSKVKKNKFRGKVLKQKIPPGTTAAPGTVVPIVIGKKT
jgi:hypothetical protein